MINIMKGECVMLEIDENKHKLANIKTKVQSIGESL